MNRSAPYRPPRLVWLLMALMGTSLLEGCASMTPGEMSVVRTDSDCPRAGNVYLLRGWIGIFSFGINNLGDEINNNGVRAHIFQDTQWSELAEELQAKYANAKNPEPLVLVGHSYGADDVLNICRKLREKHIHVDLVVTLDAVTPPKVPGNITHCYNIYQSNEVWDAVPMFRGIPLQAEPGAQVLVENGDVRHNRRDLLEPGTDHFNIEKKAKVHADVIKQILAICPPRAVWLASSHAAPVAAVTKRPQINSPTIDGKTPSPVSSAHSPAATGGASSTSSQAQVNRSFE